MNDFSGTILIIRECHDSVVRGFGFADRAPGVSNGWAERPEVRLGLHAQFGKEPGVLRVKCVGRQTLEKQHGGPGQLQLFCSAIVIKPYVDWRRFLTPFLPPDGQFGLANRRPGEVVYFP